MDGSFETTDPKRSRLLGVFVMASIALLQLATEYLGTRDASRFVSKTLALSFGLPLLIVWAFAVFRWASRKRYGALPALFVGAVTSGLFFAGLLFWARVIDPGPLRPQLIWPARIAFVVATMVVGWILAIMLVLVQHPIYPHYAAIVHRPGEITALTDQQLAGIVMMVEQLLTLGTCVALLLRPRWSRARRARLAAVT